MLMYVHSYIMYTAAPDMVGNLMFHTVRIGIDRVSFTLIWDEPFANFDPIVNYTITISCIDTHCPIVWTVTMTGTSVGFVTVSPMMIPVSVTASNTVGTSDPRTIVIDGK